MMNRYILIIFFGIICLTACSTTKQLTSAQVESEQTAIMKVMNDQEDAWNSGDIDAFMEGYWKSDRLSFTGSKGINYGWQSVKDRYFKSYPDRATMGKLQFDVEELNMISHDAFHMIGRYTLYREKDEPTGYFTLIWRKINDKWVITSDQTG